MQRVRASILLLTFAGCGSEPAPPDPIAQIPLSATYTNPALHGAVDVVRDEWGIPHIYGNSLADVSFADGYTMASDRMVQMDFYRHAAEGTLAELAGELAPSLIEMDVTMRAHKLGAIAVEAFAALQASSDPTDQAAVAALSAFAAGVNAYIADLQAGNVFLAPAVVLAYNYQTIKPWTEVDSLALGRLQAFSLSFDGDEDIAVTELRQAAVAQFDMSMDPDRVARAGIGDDLDLFAPLEPTYIRPGWNSGSDGSAHAPLVRAPWVQPELLAQARRSLEQVGLAKRLHPGTGSNNWVLGPSHTTSGHVIVANDTHLGLGSPATFYMHHLVVRDPAAPLDVEGVQFPGIPGVILGNNQKIAWGATVNVDDVTDAYAETVVTCDDGSPACVSFQGQKVKLTPRDEMIGIGKFGTVSRTAVAHLWDVPHHGPIVPRPGADHLPQPLGAQELSIRYTGHVVTQEIRAVLGIDRAQSMQEAVAALDADFKFGGQNWVIGDVDGHYGWTTVVRVPRRAPGAMPFFVLPGDGSAEWDGDLDPKWLPHDYDTPRGFVVTANNDPVGLTDGNDPLSGPMVDGRPLYLGARYDPGVRAGRITTRLNAQPAWDRDSVPKVQADSYSGLGSRLSPKVVEALAALTEEIKTPGTHPDLTALAATVDAAHAAAIDDARARLAAWSFETPAASDEEMPDAAAIADSAATSIWNAFFARLIAGALSDELAVLGTQPGDDQLYKLLTRMILTPATLKSGVVAASGESRLWDDLSTPGVTESAAYQIGKAMLAALDYLATRIGSTDPTTWRWGKLHHLIAEGLLPLDAIRLPPPNDPLFPDGFPRHGDNLAVDACNTGSSQTDFDYHDGPAIRFVAELDPQTGPRARNNLPGGEVFDPNSPHFRDQMERWRKNDAFDLWFTDADVVANAQSRTRFMPP